MPENRTGGLPAREEPREVRLPEAAERPAAEERLADGADGNAPEGPYLDPQRLHHAADLAVAPFPQHEPDDEAALRFEFVFRRQRPEEFAAVGNAADEPCQLRKTY